MSGDHTIDIETQFIVFRLDRDFFGLPISIVHEITKLGQLTSVPSGLDFVLGVMNLRGQVVPIIKLHKLLGYETSGTSSSARIIVAEAIDSVVGLRVDGVESVLNLTPADFLETSSMVAAIDDSFVHAVTRWQGSLVVLLELDRLIDSRMPRSSLRAGVSEDTGGK